MRVFRFLQSFGSRSRLLIVLCLALLLAACGQQAQDGHLLKGTIRIGGKPSGKGKVYIALQDNTTAPWLVAEVNETGSFSVSRLGIGAYFLAFLPESNTQEADGRYLRFHPYRREVDISQAVTTMDLDLPPLIEITGTLAKDQPKTGMLKLVRADSQRDETSASVDNRAFRAGDILPGKYHLYAVRQEGFSLATVILRTNIELKGETPVVDLGEISTAPGGTLDLSIEEPQVNLSLSLVSTQDGEEIIMANTSLVGGAARRLKDLPPGDYRVTMNGARAWLADPVQFKIVAGETTEVKLPVRAVTYCMLYTKSKSPIKTVKLVHENGREQPLSFVSKDDLGKMQIDYKLPETIFTENMLRIRDIEPGEWHLTVTTEEGKTYDEDLTLTPGKPISSGFDVE